MVYGRGSMGYRRSWSIVNSHGRWSGVDGLRGTSFAFAPPHESEKH